MYIPCVRVRVCVCVCTNGLRAPRRRSVLSPWKFKGTCPSASGMRPSLSRSRVESPLAPARLASFYLSSRKVYIRKNEVKTMPSQRCVYTRRRRRRRRWRCGIRPLRRAICTGFRRWTAVCTSAGTTGTVSHELLFDRLMLGFFPVLVFFFLFCFQFLLNNASAHPRRNWTRQRIFAVRNDVRNDVGARETPFSIVVGSGRREINSTELQNRLSILMWSCR